MCALSSSDGTMVTGSRDRLIKVSHANTLKKKVLMVCLLCIMYIQLYDLTSLSVNLNAPVSQVRYTVLCQACLTVWSVSLSAICVYPLPSPL